MNSTVEDRDKNVNRALSFVDEAAAKGAELIVLPEFFNTEYFAQYWDYAYFDYAEPQSGYTISRMRDKAREHGVHVVATIYEIEAPGLYFDTMFLISPQGEVVGKYRKTHPAGVRSVEKLFYRAGNNFPVWDVKGFKVGGIICYDHVFPETVRSLAVNGAELVLGPFATNGIATWEHLMITRAFENGVYMAPCNKVGQEDTWLFSGKSMVVDPFGDVVHQASGTDEEVFIADVQHETSIRARTAYPFLRDRRPEAYGSLVRSDEANRELPNHL